MFPRLLFSSLYLIISSLQPITVAATQDGKDCDPGPHHHVLAQLLGDGVPGHLGPD